MRSVPGIGAADPQRILAAAQDWAGAPMALATVVQTWASAPCPVGTHMIVHSDGAFVGSVSGGCVEGDILQVAAEVIAGAGAQLRSYGVADDVAWEVGLPCGGEIEVLVQRVDANGFAPELFGRITAAQRAGQSLIIATDLATGQSAIVDAPAPGLFNNLYAPPRRLLIIGAVEIAVTLAKIATDMGIAVTVIDPRARFLTPARFPGVIRDDRWPDEAVEALAPDSRTAVVTLSHDIKIDDPALIAALRAPTGYIAALGSRKSHAARIERLGAHGFDAGALARIEGPAGVTINSISAPEIALSVAAGMIRAFNAGLR
jgi:xanthine dehydrogenase accessory factor